MRVLSRSQFVPATTAVVLTILSVRGAIAQTVQTERVGTAAITHTTGRDPGVMLTHLQQQLARLTGVATPRDTDVETLGRALDAARARKIAPERMTALTETLAAALGTGTYDEVTVQRLAEDLFAILNNKALTGEQASLVAIDVNAVMQELGVEEPRVGIVLTALRGVCPAAVAPQPASEKDSSGQPKTPTKRSLLVLSRDSD
jgi:hypothetical protein